LKILRTIKKIFTVLRNESKQRGFYYFLIIYTSNLFAILRGLLYKVVFVKNIKSSIFFLGQRSKIDIFNKKSKVWIDKFVYIRKNSTIRVDFDCQLVIGEKVAINDNCNINCVKKISIGRYTKIGQNVCIYDHDHNYKGVGTERLLTGEVIIGENVWIGSNVIILRNTVIGDNAVIAAGSIVKGNVPNNSIYFNRRNNEITKYSLV
jgi:acetyltransferase-like isoleucine patch superfamily enzyme